MTLFVQIVQVYEITYCITSYITTRLKKKAPNRRKNVAGLFSRQNLEMRYAGSNAFSGDGSITFSFFYRTIHVAEETLLTMLLSVLNELWSNTT